MKLQVIPFDQPAGRFLLAVMRADHIIQISRADPRRFDPLRMTSEGGIQRAASERRIAEIADYATTVDATFPTPILLALPEGTYEMLDGNTINIIDNSCQADIVDGQHRIRGLKQSGLAHEFWVPVVFILEPTEEQKALMFATINGKQTKVPASLIFDLFGVSETRSPQKTAHEVARALNSISDSAWHRRLKMLGTKTPDSLESLSQGTFVKHLLPLISADPVGDMDRIRRRQPPQSHPDCIFNKFFVEERDDTILKVLLNFFNAARSIWPQEWKDPDHFILTKSVGFTGLIQALPDIYATGLAKKDLSQDFFVSVFKVARTALEREGRRLSSEHFGASGSGAGRLRDLLRDAVKRVSESGPA